MSSTERKPWHTQTVTNTASQLGADLRQGLTSADIRSRQQRHGPNELVEAPGKPPWKILWAQFTSTMVLILMVAAVASAFLGKPLETIAISAIVLLFGALGFVQEYRAERAIAALKQLAVPTVRVKRDGREQSVGAKELVPGDLVLLEAGSAIPADLRLIEANSLMIQEAALTGESEAVTKQTEPLEQTSVPLGDRVNLAYMGTQTTYGRGVGMVVATGMQTELGQIAELISTVESTNTPLQNQLEQVGRLLAVAGTLVAGLVLVIGLLLQETLSEMFLIAISVAVAVVPEGLPAVVTITLALGAQRMLKRKALIRKLPAVETLGSVDVICSDKTGTLTENRMTVTVIDVIGRSLQLVDHKATQPTGRQDLSWVMESEQAQAVGLLLVTGALCNDASLSEDEGQQRQVLGDPTEGALLIAAEQAGLDLAELSQQFVRVAELPFDSERKRMTTLHQIPSDSTLGGGYLSALAGLATSYVGLTKGSFDGLLECSSQVWTEAGLQPLDAAQRDKLQASHDRMAQKGMRVLGLAMKPHAELPPSTPEALETELVLVGLVGMIDPPRPEVRAAIERCRTAGIRPLMITGDHPLTAQFIAHDLGIEVSGGVLTGQQLSQLDDQQLLEAVAKTSVFARVSPEHKLRIVGALQAQGHTAAMTGDGVNDSPALRKADIGIAMGITGTDVSKEAAQMVLLDDNFTTIVAAVEEGRTIYGNIRHFVKFSVAGNFGKVLVMLLSPLLGITVALQPLQLLWLNLLTDGLMGLGLGTEPADKSVMQHPPRSKEARFFDRALIRYVVEYGVMIGLLGLLIGWWYFDPAHPEDRVWQTMLFTALAFMRIAQGFSSRSDQATVASLGWSTNPTMLLVTGLALGLQLAVIYLPFLEEFFMIVPLTLDQLLVAMGFGLLVFAVMEWRKLSAAPTGKSHSSVTEA